MSNRLSPEKAKAIAAEYLTNGLNKRDALLAVGYSTWYSNKNGLKLWDNEVLKAELARMQAKTELKTELKILSRAERQAFWSEVAASPDVSMADKLRASELLGKSEADFIQVVRSEHDPSSSLPRPEEARGRSEERLKLIKEAC